MILQASSLLKKTEGVVTLVVCNPRKDDGGTAVDQKNAEKPKQPEKPSKLIDPLSNFFLKFHSLRLYIVMFLLHVFIL